MKLPLTDGSGRSFDPDNSRRKWEERATDDEVYRKIRGEDNGVDAGERLFLTFDETFVLCCWNSAYSEDVQYRAIDIEEAANWLGSNGYHADLLDPALEMSHEARRLDLDDPKGF